jgi:phage head maturation protease
MTEQASEQSVIELRSLGEVSDVSFPKRTIELVVMPYEQVAEVNYHGRWIEEVCSRGAFAGVERRSSQVRVNRAHDTERTVGKAIALHPSREQGLVAEVRISPTQLGDETLVLADDGILDASAGFALLRENGRTGRIKPLAEVWETRSRRRLNALWLDHIGLTPDPAYTGASVLAVRSALAADDTPGPERAATPHLDAVRAWRLAERYARLG